MATPEPFTLNVPEAAIADLRERLIRTRFPDQAPGEPWGSSSVARKSLLSFHCQPLLQRTDLPADIAEARRPSSRVQLAKRITSRFPPLLVNLRGGQLQQARRLQHSQPRHVLPMVDRVPPAILLLAHLGEEGVAF